MYRLPKNAREAITTSAVIGYSDTAATAKIESELQKTLPAIAGLSDAMTVEERCQVYAKSIEVSREAFIAMNGDSFGCDQEETAVKREHTALYA